MARAALSINHAGHGTVCAALQAGVPIFAMPNPAADQPYLATRIVELGAGERLERDAGVEEIRHWVGHLLSQPRYAIEAGRLRDAIAAAPGVAGAAGWLEGHL